MQTQMTFEQYRIEAVKTASGKGFGAIPMLVYSLGLVDEAIEVEEALDQLRFAGSQFTPAMRTKLIKELGDVTWYLALIYTLLFYTAEGDVYRPGEPLVDLTQSFYDGYPHDTEDYTDTRIPDKRMRAAAKDVGERTKKIFGHGHSMDYPAYLRDMSRVMYNLLVLADQHGINHSQIFQANIDKLRARYTDGKFNTADSVNHKPEDA